MWITVPWESAITCTSMCRPCSTYFSTRIVSSPNAASASRFAAATASSYSPSERTMRMPLPPPPEAALTRTGKDMVSTGSTDGGSTDGGSTDGGSTDGGSTDGGSTDGWDGTTGTPAATAISRAASLRPIL